MAKAGQDPREIITPDAFSVAPHLLGTPLARPWRRGIAMGVDLLLIAIIAGLRVSWLLLFLAITVLAVRAAFRPSATRLRKGTRWAVFGSLAFAGLGATLIAGVDLVDSFNPFSKLAAVAVSDEEGGDESGGFDLGGVIGAATGAVAIQSATSGEELRVAAADFARGMERLGVEPDTIRQTLVTMVEGREEPWARDAMNAALGELGLEPVETEERTDRDSLVLAYTAALESGDTLVTRALGDPMADAFAGERISRLRRDNEELENQLELLEDEMASGESSGILGFLLRILDEIGIELGWSALYFTMFPVFWSGKTPGKRVARVRIVRLDGKPIGWWAALNRFGGYAASIFTGLLGFFEMFWDANRQALQDRIASTVVISEPKHGAVAAVTEAKP